MDILLIHDKLSMGLSDTPTGTDTTRFKNIKDYKIWDNVFEMFMPNNKVVIVPMSRIHRIHIN